MTGWEQGSIAKNQVGGHHYKGLPIQPLDYAEENGLSPTEFSIIKYVTRHRSKGKFEDLKKAAHYLKILMEREYAELMNISYGEEEEEGD